MCKKLIFLRLVFKTFLKCDDSCHTMGKQSTNLTWCLFHTVERVHHLAKIRRFLYHITRQVYKF